MLNRDQQRRFVGAKFKKINGLWYKGKCTDCQKLLTGQYAKRCQTCWAKTIKGNSLRVPSRKGITHSAITKEKISQTKRVPDPSQLSYSALHNRVRSVRGRADHCEHKGCLGRSRHFQWANVSGEYKGLDDFIQLCSSCHKYYDKGKLILEIVE